MRIAGNYTFEATRIEVWEALNDPETLARTIPGCQRLEQIGEAEFESTLKVGLQAVRGTYHGRVKIEDPQPPHSYHIAVDGKGNNGFLKGQGTVSLREDGENTILDYGGEAQVGGTIASVGQRLLDGAAKTLINQSLKALAAQIEARRNGTPEAVTTPEAAQPGPLPADTSAIVEKTPTDGEQSPASAAAATPAEPAASAAPAAGFQRRSIDVPPHERLSEEAVAKGAWEDFIAERPWFPWVLVAFLFGYILGRRK